MDPKLPDDQLKRLQEQRHEKRIVRKIVMYVGIAIIAIALIGSISSYFYISNALKPVDPDNKKAVKIE